MPTRRAFINITNEVEAAIAESGITEGLVLVNAMHITASVFINDDEGGLHRDYEEWLETLAPHEPISRYQHNNTGEDNGDAHLKRQIMGREVSARSPRELSTSAPGNRYSTESSTEGVKKGYW